jgi:hypothetical protein
MTPDVTDTTLLLLWRGRPVCRVRGVGPVNAVGWVSADFPSVYEEVWGATFAPGTFPKELADAWAWVDADPDENGADGWPDEDVMGGWSVECPDGTVRPIVMGHIDFARGRVYCRWA